MSSSELTTINDPVANLSIWTLIIKWFGIIAWTQIMERRQFRGNNLSGYRFESHPRQKFITWSMYAMLSTRREATQSLMITLARTRQDLTSREVGPTSLHGSHGRMNETWATTWEYTPGLDPWVSWAGYKLYNSCIQLVNNICNAPYAIEDHP